MHDIVMHNRSIFNLYDWALELLWCDCDVCMLQFVLGRTTRREVTWVCCCTWDASADWELRCLVVQRHLPKPSLCSISTTTTAPISNRTCLTCRWSNAVVLDTERAHDVSCDPTLLHHNPMYGKPRPT